MNTIFVEKKEIKENIWTSVLFRANNIARYNYMIQIKRCLDYYVN